MPLQRRCFWGWRWAWGILCYGGWDCQRERVTRCVEMPPFSPNEGAQRGCWQSHILQKITEWCVIYDIYIYVLYMIYIIKPRIISYISYISLRVSNSERPPDAARYCVIDMPFSDEPVCLFDHFDPWISIGKTIGKTAMTSCELTRDVFLKIELCMDSYKLNVHSSYIPLTFLLYSCWLHIVTSSFRALSRCCSIDPIARAVKEVESSVQQMEWGVFPSVRLPATMVTSQPPWWPWWPWCLFWFILDIAEDTPMESLGHGTYGTLEGILWSVRVVTQGY